MSYPDNKFGTLYIKKRSTYEWFAFLLFILPFAFSLLTDILRLPDIIKYSMDLILISLLGIMLINGQFTFDRRMKHIVILVISFFAYTTIAYMFHFQSVFYYIWGLRNNFRFFTAFFVFSIFVTYDDAIQWLKILDVIFWINFALMIYQFFVMHKKQDYLGGIFGTDIGTNGFTLAFFCIIVTKSLLSLFNGKESVLNCVAKCIASLVGATMAEMKFFYFLFIFVLILTSFLTKISKKKFIIVVCGIVLVIICSNIMINMFGFEGFFSSDGLWEYATKENYSTDRDINRISAIFTLSKNIMTNTADILFGLGLGNCDLSSISIFNSTFYQNYSYLHYSWFTGPMIFLETGLFGLAIYLSFYISCITYSIKQKKKGEGEVLFNQLAAVMGIVCILLVFYNSSLRIDAAYTVFFILALPFIKKDREEESPLLD